jgi:hypothetical protein
VPTKKKSAASALLVKGADAAIELLKTPEAQAQIVDAAGVVIGRLKDMGKARHDGTKGSPEGVMDGGGRSGDGKPKALVGNKKLERRVSNLSENVALLRSSAGPVAEHALGEIDQVIERMQVAVTMADNLPLVKRQRAHREIDAVLDKLERAVFTSVMQ